MLLFKTELVRPDDVPGAGRDAAAAPTRASHLSQRMTVSPNQLTSTTDLDVGLLRTDLSGVGGLTEDACFLRRCRGRQEQICLSCALFADRRRTWRGGSGVPPADPPVAGPMALPWVLVVVGRHRQRCGVPDKSRTAAPYDRRERYSPCQQRKEPA